MEKHGRPRSSLVCLDSSVCSASSIAIGSLGAIGPIISLLLCSNRSTAAKAGVLEKFLAVTFKESQYLAMGRPCWSIEQAVSSLRPMVLILNPLTSIPMLFDLYVFASCSRKAGGSAVTVPNYGTRRTRSIGRRSSSRSILKMLRWSIACRWSASWIDCGWSASQGMSSGVQTIKDGVGKDFQRQRPPSFSMLMHWMIKSSWLADAWGISCNRETQGDPGENPMRLLSGIWA